MPSRKPGIHPPRPPPPARPSPLPAARATQAAPRREFSQVGTASQRAGPRMDVKDRQPRPGGTGNPLPPPPPAAAGTAASGLDTLLDALAPAMVTERRPIVRLAPGREPAVAAERLLVSRSKLAAALGSAAGDDENLLRHASDRVAARLPGSGLLSGSRGMANGAPAGSSAPATPAPAGPGAATRADRRAAAGRPGGRRRSAGGTPRRIGRARMAARYRRPPRGGAAPRGALGASGRCCCCSAGRQHLRGNGMRGAAWTCIPWC